MSPRSFHLFTCLFVTLVVGPALTTVTACSQTPLCTRAPLPLPLRLTTFQPREVWLQTLNLWFAFAQGGPEVAHQALQEAALPRRHYQRAGGCLPRPRPGAGDAYRNARLPGRHCTRFASLPVLTLLPILPAYPPCLQDCLPPAEPDATVAIAVPTSAPLPDGIALLTQAVSVSP